MTVNYLKVSISVILLLSITLITKAQNSPTKFGEITKEDFVHKACPIDSSAHAYYIFNCGKIKYSYNRGTRMATTKHFRIKIIDNQGFDWADIYIPLFSEGVTAEKVSRIRGYTYNLEEDKIIKTKLSKDNILEDEISKEWNQKIVSMPEVKDGSIVELEYTIVSRDAYNIDSWDFQKSIPVLISNFQVSIPEDHKFRHILGGYIDIAKEEISKEKIRIEDKSTVSYTEISTLYSAKNIPSFIEEPYLRSPLDYISNIYFEFISTDLSGYSSWKDIDNDLTISPDFGLALKRDNHLNDIAKSIKESSKDDTELTNIALNIVKQKIEWNEICSGSCSRSLSKVLKDGYGNSADINLNLVALLRLLGLQANPVLLSTQSNGKIKTDIPSTLNFNYVIATVKIGDEYFILDATDIDSRINVVPYRVLNYKGRVITPTHGYWLDLEGYSSAKESTFYNIDISKELKIEGVFQNRSTDYAAYDKIKDICSYQYVDEYEEELENRVEGVSLKNLTITNIDDRNIVLKADLINPDLIDKYADTLYIPAVIEPFLSGNPFDTEARKYPIEFDVAASEEYICNISIPEGYQFTQIPKAVSIKSEDQSIIFKYQVIEKGSSAVVKTSLTINKTIFLPNEYEVLRQIFQLVYDKQHEMIVIQKI